MAVTSAIEAAPRARAVAPTIFLLADHLDAALAHGEDLLALTFTPPSPAAVQSGAEIDADIAAWKAFVSTVRAREMAITLRILQARRRLAVLAIDKPLARHALTLFSVATAPLQDAAGRLADGNVDPLESGHDLHAFLVGRGLIGAAFETTGTMAPLAVTDAYPLAGMQPLGQLLDLVARTLDVLDAAYGLYDDTGDAVRPTAIEPVRSTAKLAVTPVVSAQTASAAISDTKTIPLFSASDAALAAAVALASSVA